MNLNIQRKNVIEAFFVLHIPAFHSFENHLIDYHICGMLTAEVDLHIVVEPQEC